MNMKTLPGITTSKILAKVEGTRVTGLSQRTGGAVIGPKDTPMIEMILQTLINMGKLTRII